MEDFNIDYYRNYQNVTIAEYVAGKNKVETKFINSIKKGKIREALKFAGLYIELDKLLSKRLSYGNKYGYDGKGKNK